MSGLRTAEQEMVAQLQARIASLEARLARQRDMGSERAEFLRRAFEDAPIGMALVGLDERIVEANAALCQMLGYSHDELLRLTVPQITHPDDVNLEAQPKEAMADGASLAFVIEKRYVRADGRVLTGRLSVSALCDADGQPTYYLGQLEDVTGARLAELALREHEAQVAHARRLDSLGRLAGGVAHDFNNMLTVILGVADTLLETFPPHDPAVEDLGLIREAAVRARDLTGQLLAVGRQKHGAPVALRLDQHLLANEKLLARVLGEDVRLTLALDATTAPILIDPSQLEQVILNLATNARDAMPQGGEFTLRTWSVTLNTVTGPLPAGRYVALDARDTGGGIAPEHQEHIFDPFFTTKKTGRGTGLGLATVYGIVRQAGGEVTVNSQPGQGSLFTLLLPAASATAGPESAHTAGSGWSGAEVLVVEDDEAVRRVVVRILERGGYSVLAPASPEEALAVAATDQPIDIVVTDVVMPNLSGPEVYARIAELRGPVPVVFMSGYAKAAHSSLGEHAGFITKPFTPSALLAKVRAQLATRAALIA